MAAGYPSWVRDRIRDITILRMTRAGPLATIRERLLASEGGRIDLILLHGSRATVTARPDSDYDVLVVVDGPVEDWARECTRLSELYTDLPYAVDVQVMGREDFELERHVVGSLAHPATREGIALYQRGSE